MIEPKTDYSSVPKKKAYLQYLTTHSETDKLEYKRLVAIVKRETRKIKRQCWEIFKTLFNLLSIFNPP